MPYGAAPTPHATASWGISKSYPPVPAQVLAVACPSSTVCYAVGRNNNGTGAILSLSSTSVTTWVADTIPSGTNQINAIACPSSTVCYAVGQNNNGTATILSLSSTGTSPPSWVADTLPSGTSEISALACPSTSVCYAGGYDVNSEGIILSLSSTISSPPSWQSDTGIPSAADIVNVITCPSTSVCYAGGYGTSSNGTNTVSIFSLSSTGTSSSPPSWQSDTGIPSTTSQLDAIACLSATACYAGGYDVSSDGIILSLSSPISSPPSWESDTVPSGTSSVDAIACPPSSAVCYAAAGTILSLSPSVSPSLASRSSISPSWQSDTGIPLGTSVDAIACPSTSVCYAGGLNNNGSATILSLSSTGTSSSPPSWSTDTLPPGTKDVGAIACPSSTVCYAASQNSDGSGTILSLSGGSWEVDTGIPSGISVNAIACPSVTVCYAGAFNTILSLSSTSSSPPSWQSDTGIPVGTSVSAIACPSSTVCYAAGGSTILSLSSATKWVADTLPSGTSVNAIACPSSTVCFAAGYDSSSNAGTILSLSSASSPPSWTADGLPAGTGSIFHIACPSSTVCYAAGGSTILSLSNSSTTQWVADTLPSGTSVNAFACPSSTVCYAAGGNTILSLSSTTTWAADSVPSGSNSIFAIACSSTTVCYAAGGSTILSPSSTTTWAADTIPLGVGSVNAFACPSASVCYAAGMGSTEALGALILVTSSTATVPPPSQPSPPTVSSISPTSGPAGGGTTVTITGSNLSGAAYVHFGSVVAESFTVVSGTEISAVSPAGTAGSTVNVTVTTPGGTSATSSADLFTYFTNVSRVGYHPVTPARICDTRSGNPSKLSGATLTNCEGKAPGAAQVLTIDVAGLAGVPSNATAVVLDVTAVDPSANGYLAVYPAGGSNPGASSVNFTAGSVATANLVVVALPTSGQVSIYNSAGTTNVVVDVEGYVGAETSPGTGLYVPLSPSRICDTRAGNPSKLSGAALTNCEGKAPAPGTSLEVPVLGLGGVPASNVSAVVVNLTAIDPMAAGYLTAYPAGTSPPMASQLNYAAGQIVANSVVVPLGTNGAIDIYSFSGTPNIAVDVEGYITGSANPSATGSVIVPAASPARICDTRAGNPSNLSGAALTNCEGKTLSATSPLDVQVTGLGGVPTDATAVIVNITATDTTASSYLTAYPTPSGSTTQPAGTTQPLTSVLNWAAGQTRADLAIVPVGSGGQITFSVGAGSTNVIVDVVGWVVPATG